jgi:TorA maturation chaperone TorD
VVLEEHLVDYCRLFLGPGDLRCPPYGSVYLDGGVAMGPSTLDALTRYRQEGFAVTPDWREPSDHVAIELDFMAHLAFREAGACERRDAGTAQAAAGAQRRFLDGHLGRWGPALSRRLAAGAEAPLYQLLSELLPAWVDRDRNLLAAAAYADLEGAH